MTNMHIPTLTLSRFLRQKERESGVRSGEFTELIMSISVGVKFISQLVITAGFKGLQGYTGNTNVQNEQVHALDEAAHDILVEILGSSGHFGLLVSEESDNVISTSSSSVGAKYVVAFDPLDGSSNVGTNIPVGTIFSIWKKLDLSKPASVDDFLQSGSMLIAAGYAVYGSKTSFVYSTGSGVYEFTLDPSIGEFILINPEVKTPVNGKIFSINDANQYSWSEKTQKFIQQLKTPDNEGKIHYSSRYAGSLVADFHRNLVQGGIFLYPATSKDKNGKLRLLYEVIPMSFIQEQAGGLAIDGENRILDIVPISIHQRIPFVVGSKREVEMYKSMT